MFNLPKLEGKDLLLSLTILLATLCPGFLIIYQYRPDLVKEYDILKLALFAVSLTLPLLLINIFVITKTISKAKPDQNPTDQTIKGCIAGASFVSCLSLYGAMLVTYFYPLKFRCFFGIIIRINTGYIAFVSLMEAITKWAKSHGGA